MVFLISFLAFLATFLGGMFALRFVDKSHLIKAFSAGAIIGVAFFDLLTEGVSLGSGSYGTANMIAIAAGGYLLYMLIDRVFIMHSHDPAMASKTFSRGTIGALSLSLHSFLDGAAIGLAFKVNVAAGIIVATAVLVHDFSDGINTVNVVLKNNGEEKQARTWLLVDAIAPVIGVISTVFFTLSQSSLAIVLAVFSGFFLYIGASDLLPESYHDHPTGWTTCMTILGAGVLFVAIKLAGI